MTREEQVAAVQIHFYMTRGGSGNIHAKPEPCLTGFKSHGLRESTVCIGAHA